MNKRYIIRFKTKKEFIQEFGTRWRTVLVRCSFPTDMDYLLGLNIDFHNEEVYIIERSLYTDNIEEKVYDIIQGDNREKLLLKYGNFYISQDMLVAIPLKPTYKKKRVL